MESTLPSIKPEELADNFYDRLAKKGLRPSALQLPYAFTVDDIVYAVSLVPEERIINIGTVNSTIISYAHFSPTLHPPVEFITPVMLNVLEEAFKAVVKQLSPDRYVSGFSNEASSTEEVMKELKEMDPDTPIVDAMRESSLTVKRRDRGDAEAISQLWRNLLDDGLFAVDRRPFVTQDGQVAVFISRHPFLISVCTNTGNVLKVPAGHLEGSGTGFKRICWLRYGSMSWDIHLENFGFAQLISVLNELKVSLQGESRTLGADPGFARWVPGPKGYIPRETFGSDTEAYITHLERVIELGRMTPVEFMEDAKRSAAELEQMYPTPARLISPLPRHPHTDAYLPHQLDLSALADIDLSGKTLGKTDWTVVVTPPVFMSKTPSKVTMSLPPDPVFDSFVNSEFMHKWMELIHSTNETFRLEGNERLSSVESSIRFEVADWGVPMIVRPAGEPNKFYLEEDQPKGTRLADLTLEGDRITVDVRNDNVFPIAGAEQVLTAMLTAIKEHMTK